MSTKKSRRHAQVSAVALGFSMLPIAAALAQQAPIETIVVTAQGRAEKLQEVPISVMAFSAKQIENAGITSTQDFINLTPNMSFDNSYTYANSFVVVRGIANFNNTDSPVAVVVDGVPQNNSKQLKMNLFDISRIEVLKGPQGALYGRNAVGGAINIETKRPSNKAEGFVSADYASGNTQTIAAGLSGPINESVLFRLGGQFKTSDGQVSNTYLNRKVDAIDHDYSVRGKLLVRAGENLQLDLRASVTDFKAGAITDNQIVSGNNNDVSAAPRSNLLGQTEGRTKELSFKADLDLGFANLTATTAYTDLVEKNRGDLDWSNPDEGSWLANMQVGQGQNLKTTMRSQEIRLTSPNAQSLRWLGGVFYLHTQRNLQTSAFLDTTGTLGQFDDVTKRIVHLHEDNRNTAASLFGQADYDIRKDLTVSAALRYDQDKRHQLDLVGGVVREHTFSAWQPKTTLTWRHTPGSLVYATYGTGFRSGGFNAPAPKVVEAGLDMFKDEYLRNLEFGSKSAWLDNRLFFNAALYFQKVRNAQYFYIDGPSAAQILANIDRVEIKGVDIDFRYAPGNNMEFDGGLGTTDSEIKKNQALPSSVGNKSPKTTPLKLNLGWQMSVPMASGLTGFMRIDYEHRSKKYWFVDNKDVQGGVDLVNLRIGARGIGDQWSVYLFGRNLGNEKYYADYNSSAMSGLPINIGSLAPLRSIGIEARFRM